MKTLYITGCIVLVLLIASCARPSAAELAERFRDQKSTFESVVAHLQVHDGNPQQAFTEDPEFGAKLRQLGIHSGRFEDACHIWLSTQTDIANSGRSERGYAFLCEEPKSLVANIDRRGERAQYYEVYQPIEGQWYLFANRHP